MLLYRISDGSLNVMNVCMQACKTWYAQAHTCSECDTVSVKFVKNLMDLTVVVFELIVENVR